MAETDKSQVVGEGREPGFYWVSRRRYFGAGELWSEPMIADWLDRGHGPCWYFAAEPWRWDERSSNDVRVLSPRLEPPK